jgi:hypothetical protein
MKTTDGGLHWERISPDLTGGKPRQAPATASVVSSGAAAAARNSIDEITKRDGPTPQNAIERGYGTLATVAPSYLDKDVIWAGSDTGVISLTRDGGKSWANVTPPAMRPWSRVALIDPSRFDPAAAYAAVERHRVDDQAPYIYRTLDYGKTWEPIMTGLAAPAFVNAVREDPKLKGLLYAGTEFGVYVSFDNGDHWQSLQLNLPITSVRDLVVHGDDLVVATHGRSFWILDDITPLRQAAERGKAGAPFLYKPQTAVRVDSDAFPGTPLPPEEPTAENPPDGAILDYYLPSVAHTLELRIYNSDHKLVRHVSSKTESEANHKSLPIAERWFPVPQRLETSAGMHRFIWNLAWGTSGVADSDEPDDGNGDVPRGPRVPPGNYLVQLRADGKQLPDETLTVIKDPRSPASPTGLQKQFETSYAIFADSLQSRRALAEIGSVQEQLSKLKPGGAARKADLDASVKEVTSSIAAILSGASTKPAMMGLEEANTALTAALHVSESSDRATPSQALAIYAQAHKDSAARVQEWTTLKRGALERLNRQLKEQGEAPIAVAEIEREVYYLMTR